LRSYPPELEAWWVQQLSRIFHHAEPHTALRELEPEIQELSDLFTAARPSIFTDYTDNERLLLAYGLFFFPQSFIRVKFPLHELIAYRKWPGFAERNAIRVLDIGCGLGATGLATAHYLSTVYPHKEFALTAVDHSSTSLDYFNRLHRAHMQLWPQCSLTTHYAKANAFIRQRQAHQWDLITLGFSFNELAANMDQASQIALLERITTHLAHGGVLCMLEPALRDTAENLQKISDHLLANKQFYSWGPYLSQAPCPLLKTGKFWNHEVRTWNPPASLAFANRRLFRSIEELKYSYCLLSHTAPPTLPATPRHFRLVSPLRAIKGRLIAAGVATDGNRYTYDIPTRGLKKNAIKALQKQYERGDVVIVSELEALNQAGTFRIQNMDKICEHFHIQ